MGNSKSILKSVSSPSLILESSVESTVPLWEGIMGILAMHSLHNKDLQTIILLFLTNVPSLLKPSPKLNEFFISRPTFTMFPPALYNLAEADQHSIWGRPEEVKCVLESNHNPSLLITNVDGEDHRGPAHIPSGTLLVRAVYLGDFSMASLLKPYILERCGEEEFKRQLDRTHQVIEEESRKKAKTTIEKDDLRALNDVWNILKNANEKNLQSNTDLEAALVEFQNQLGKPGNEKVIEEAVRLYDRDVAEFSGYTNLKNIFAANKIFGLAQRMRLPVCILQNFFTGLIDVGFKQAETKRIDVRRELGVFGAGNGVVALLGSSCHLDANGLKSEAAGDLGNTWKNKTSIYKKLSKDWIMTHHATSLGLK